MSRLIVITDIPIDFYSANVEDRNLECNSINGTKAILNAIRKVYRNVLHYYSVDSFLKNINQHKEDIIFPLLYGLNTPSSKSIIPAICEGANIKYIGADPYSHILCNDKKLSTQYARDFGIQSANSVLLRFINPLERRLVDNLKLPLIVKPNFGGGSTGISASNIVYTHSNAYELARHLWQSHKIPILIEEVLEGYEVEFIIVGNQKQILFSSEVKLLLDNQDYFTEKIWSYETKKINDNNVEFINSNLLSSEIKENMINLFQSFSKIEFMRIDGRFRNGEFYLIELSPDCYLGDDCAVAAAFLSQNISYEDMFKVIINNSLNPDLFETSNNLKNLLDMGILHKTDL